MLPLSATLQGQLMQFLCQIVVRFWKPGASAIRAWLPRRDPSSLLTQGLIARTLDISGLMHLLPETRIVLPYVQEHLTNPKRVADTNPYVYRYIAMLHVSVFAHIL